MKTVLILLAVLLASAAGVLGGLWYAQQQGGDSPGTDRPTAPAASPALTVDRGGAAVPLGPTTNQRIGEEAHIVTPPTPVPTPIPTTPTPGPATVQPQPNADPDIPIIDADQQRTGHIPSPRPTVTPAPLPPPTDGRQYVAVLPFIHEGYIPESQAGKILSGLLVTKLDNTRFRVIERAGLPALIEEQMVQGSDLVTAAACQGRIQGVHMLILGNLSRLSHEFHLTARAVNCTTGEVHGTGWVRLANMAQAADKIAELAHLLRVSGAAGPVATPTANSKPDWTTIVNPDPAAAKVSLRVEPQKDVYVADDRIRFVVQTDRDCYITLVHTDVRGMQTLLMPNRWQRSAFVQADTPTAIPADSAGFYFFIKPPYGEDVVKAIATPEPPVLNEVITKSIAADGFAPLSKPEDISFKGIGAAAEGASLSDRFSTAFGKEKWATGEITVITAAEPPPPAPAQSIQSPPPPTGADPIPAGQSFHIAPPTGDDPNDKVLERWGALMANHLPPPNDLLAAAAPSSAAPAELLEFRKGPDGTTTMHIRDASSTPTAGALVVVPNFSLHTFGLPATKLAEVQWALHNRFSPGHDIGYADAADRIRAIPPAKLPLIGLIDTGFCHTDPRLAHAAWTNPREIPDNGIDDDRNGYIDDVHGYNFLERSPRLYDPARPFDHGTFVGSIIAARPIGSENDLIGLLPQAKIITAVALRHDPLRVYSPGEGNLAAVLQAIRYVVDQGAKVLNLSFGSPVTAAELAVLNKIPLWDELEARGVLLICAAGNSNSNNDQQPVFPASLPRKNVISVMAIDAAGRPARAFDPGTRQWRPFTNYGPKTVDLAAPGAQITGIHRTNDVTLSSGTSFAAPMVTAAVAVSRLHRPATRRGTLRGKVCQDAAVLDLASSLPR